MTPQVHHRYATVDGQRLFYREAGPADAPAVVLLHGFPTSSFMFRDLIPQLAGSYHVIAPDHLGFGFSDAPAVADFDYTFDALADLTAAPARPTRGGPLRHLRPGLRRTDRVAAGVAQSGSDHRHRDPERKRLRRGFRRVASGRPCGTTSASRTRPPRPRSARRWPSSPSSGSTSPASQDETLVSPDTWTHDAALVDRPGNDEIQLRLFLDYATNAPMYPALHDYLRTSEVPVLAVWGKGDLIFGPDGARAFEQDAKDAEIHLIDGGHFLLESAGRRGRGPDALFPAAGHRAMIERTPTAGRRHGFGEEEGTTMGLAWQQGPLGVAPIGHFLTAQPLPERLLFAEPLRRRMRVRLGDQWIADSEDVVLLHEPARYPVAYFPRADVLARRAGRREPDHPARRTRRHGVVHRQGRRPRSATRRLAAHCAARACAGTRRPGRLRLAGDGRLLRRGRPHRRDTPPTRTTASTSGARRGIWWSGTGTAWSPTPVGPWCSTNPGSPRAGTWPVTTSTTRL